jgi:hypothetical protein
VALVPPEDAVFEEALEGVVAVVLVVVVEVAVVGVVDALATVEVGTVSGGTAVVSAAGVPPPPHPDNAVASSTGVHNMASFLITAPLVPPPPEPSGLKRLHPPAAVRAVVEVLLAELIAPVAEPQVLDRPRQLGGGGGEWQHFGHDLKLLAGFAIDVGVARIRFDDDLAARGRRPHAVFLARPHENHPIVSFG